MSRSDLITDNMASRARELGAAWAADNPEATAPGLDDLPGLELEAIAMEAGQLNTMVLQALGHEFRDEAVKRLAEGKTE